MPERPIELPSNEAMSLLKDKIFSSLAWTHFIVDVMNSQRGILLAYFSGPFGLSNTTLGGINTLYAFSGSLAQPVFGYLADRFGPRWVITGGVLWMAGFFALAVTIPGPVALVFLVLASLGSGAFHPAGSLSATMRGKRIWQDSRPRRHPGSSSLVSWPSSWGRSWEGG